MATNDFKFMTHWTIPGATVQEIHAVLSDVESLPEWWPAVCLSVEKVPGSGDENGIGREYDILCKGWLPYTPRWRMTVRETNRPYGATIGAAGDFNGQGIWLSVPTPSGVDVSFDWQIASEKPIVQWLANVLQPIFTANYGWAMEQGRVSLLRELERRRKDAAPVPPPPAPTTWQPYAAIGGVLAVVALVVGVVVRSRKELS